MNDISQSRKLQRLAIKLLNEEELIQFSLNENKVAYLLVEELQSGDIDSLRDTVQETHDLLGDMVKKFEAANIKLLTMPEVSQYVQQLKAALDKADQSIAELDLENPDKIIDLARKHWGQESDAAGIMRAAMAIQGRVSQFVLALRNGMITIVDELNQLNVDKDVPIINIAGQDPVPPIEKIKQGMLTAFKEGIPAEGFWSKLMRVFARGAGLEDKIMEEIGAPDLVPVTDRLVALSIEELNTLANDLAATPAQPPTPEPGVVQDIQAQAEEAAIEGEEGQLTPAQLAQADKQAEEAAQDLGAVPIKKLALTDLLKKYPELSGKGNRATAQRRAFRKAVNKVAGKQVFEEGYLPMLNEMLINPTANERPILEYDESGGWTKEDLIQRRWARMAGLNYGDKD